MLICPVLSQLREPYRIEYEEELLELLHSLLHTHHHLTPDVVIVLSSLHDVYRKNDNKLGILRHVYHALSSQPGLVREVSYEYPQLVRIYLQLAADYLLHSFSPQEYLYYPSETL